MKFLLDTHLLLWAAASEEESVGRLSKQAAALIDDEQNELLFSAASLWEITIKRGLGRADFLTDPHVLRRGLIDHGYTPLAISSEHALAVGQLRALHRDPFDRMLIAQATVEGITLLTADPMLSLYSGPIRMV